MAYELRKTIDGAKYVLAEDASTARIGKYWQSVPADPFNQYKPVRFTTKFAAEVAKQSIGGEIVEV